MTTRETSSNAYQISDLYDEDYFRGKTSGYPEQGYSEAHPDWTPWLEYLTTISSPPASLIELGCAFGFFTAGAREVGYQAFGIDVSSFALRQERLFAEFLLQGELATLPLRDQCADIVTAFDVLEHLHHPEAALAEAVRIMKPESLLIGATPDPLFFNRHEETHFSERPPSVWLNLLEDLGLQVFFRFSGPAYNFQFIAAFPGSQAAAACRSFGHDYFAHHDDFVCTTGGVSAVPRFGWGPIEGESRKIEGGRAAIYIRNSSSSPKRMSLAFEAAHTSAFSTMRVRLNSLVLTEVALDSEALVHQFEFNDLIIPSGGHHVFFDVFPGGPSVSVSNVRLAAQEAGYEELCQQLPFDLYQRYQLASDLAGLLKPETVLDVGGVLGDRDGHLAASADFFRSEAGEQPAVISTDIRQCDLPGHFPSDAGSLPFVDSSFDLVVSLDVLEHIPPEQRRGYFSELLRVAQRWVILGAPIESDEVVAVENELRETLNLPFLAEHAEMGLPSESLIKGYFEGEAGCSVIAVPNGFLPRWKELQLLTQLFFSMRRIGITRLFNQLCNQACYPYDQSSPSYRVMYVIAKNPFDSETAARLEGLRSPSPHPGEPSCQELMAQDPRFAQLILEVFLLQHSQEKALIDAQFLLNQRQEHIDLLLNEIQVLKSTPLLDIARERFRRRTGL